MDDFTYIVTGTLRVICLVIYSWIYIKHWYSLKWC